MTTYIDPQPTAVTEPRVRLRDLLRRDLLRQNLVASILATTLFAGVASLTIYIPTVLVDLGYAAGSAASISSLITFGGLLGGVLGIVVGHRLPRRVVLGGCAFGSMLALLVLAIEGSTVLVVALGFAVALAFQVFSGSFWGYLPELYPTAVRALGVSFATTVGLVLGASLGPLASGALLNAFGASVMFAVLACVTLLMLAAALIGPETHRKALLES